MRRPLSYKATSTPNSRQAASTFFLCFLFKGTGFFALIPINRYPSDSILALVSPNVSDLFFMAEFISTFTNLQNSDSG